MTERSLASRQARRSKRGGTGRGVDRRQGLACRQRELTGDVRMELQRSPRQELLKGVGTGRLERDQELHVHAQVQTRSWNLPSAPHKSLFLAAVWIWVAARGNLSTKLWGVANCNFAASPTCRLMKTCFFTFASREELKSREWVAWV